VRLADNPFLQSYLRTETARYWRQRSHGFSEQDRLEQRGNIIVLKSPAADEKGVLLLKYPPHFYKFVVNFDVIKVMQSFHLVLEPSWFPYPEPHWALFACQESMVVCQTISEDAAAEMREWDLGLVPIPIGAQDWVDPETFNPKPAQKDF